MSRSLSESLHLPVVLQRAIDGAVSMLGLDCGVIYMLEGEQLFLGAAVPPLPPDFPDEHRFARLADHNHISRCIFEDSPVVVDDVLQEQLSPQERLVVESRNLRSAIFVPLSVEGARLGTFIVQTIGATRTFTEHDVDLCRIIAHQISLALSNARLFQNAQDASINLAQAYDATLIGWSRALEMRDAETSGHTERVTEMAVDLAREMGMRELDLVHLRRGALLHDIGKMCLPDDVLYKEGPLTEVEWVLVRQHPLHAVEMLEGIQFLAPALVVPRHHHERWDGTGYPAGLKGEEIPLYARIFAVADVFDALTSNRPYRTAWSREQALAYIAAESGTHFDPAAVTALLAIATARGW